MEKKQTNKEPQEKEGQLTCLSCNNKKILVVYVKEKEGSIVFTLLCNSCGSLFPLHLNANILMDDSHKIEITKSSPPSYV